VALSVSSLEEQAVSPRPMTAQSKTCMAFMEILLYQEFQILEQLPLMAVHNSAAVVSWRLL
jgi:hypothetical protein